MDESTFLRHLLAEAPVEAFEEPLRLARTRGDTPQQIDRLQEVTLVALQIRSILLERRRREGELAAISETAGDLLAIRDVDRVLQAIARRGRRLLRADTAYLTLLDDVRGDTYMRVTEGTVGEEFRKLRLPLGVGLGGLVAQNARPSFTPNYLEDPRFLHTEQIDSAVSLERIVAILGVPLIVGEQIIGVLFAADRSERHFSPGEVNLLASMAAHAALAIENARLFQEAQRALSELSAAHAVVRAHSEAVERAAAVHERLTDIVLQGGDIEEVATTLASVLESDVSILDTDARVFLGTDGGGGLGGLEEGLDRARATGRTARVDDGDTCAWVTAVVAGAEQLGALVLRGRPHLDGADLRTLERGAQVTALLLLNQRSMAATEQRLLGELLDDVLTSGRREPERVRRRSRLLGIDLDAEHVIAVASGGERVRVLAAAAALVSDRGGLVAERSSSIVILLPHLVPRDAGRLVSERLSGHGSCVTVGAAGPVRGVEEVAAAYEDAARCCRVLLALGRVGDAATVAELGVYALLFSQAGRTELEAFVEATLGSLLAYDAARGTELAETLEAWFGAGQSVTHAAKVMHVHVNTLYQRLDRIRSLLDADPQDAERGLQLHLALTIRRLGVALGGV